MKLEDLQNHLRENLPLHTDRFNDWNSDSISISGNTATITTSSAHGFSAGDYVNVRNVVFNNPLSSLVADTRTVEGVTQYPNDMTEGYTESINIEGSDIPELNGSFSNNIDFSDDGYSFSYRTSINSGADSGNAYLIESDLARYNNRFQITNIVSTTVFEFEINNTFNDGSVKFWPDFVSDCEWSNFRVRIGTMMDLDHAYYHYTDKSFDEWWMFITPSPATVSKSRNTDLDFDDDGENGARLSQYIEKEYTFWTFININNDLSKMKIMDECSNELLKAIHLSLLGFVPCKFWNASYKKFYYKGEIAGPDRDRTVYMHGHQFGLVVEMSEDDGYVPKSVKLNGIDIKYYDKYNEDPEREIIANDTYNYNKEAQ